MFCGYVAWQIHQGNLDSVQCLRIQNMLNNAACLFEGGSDFVIITNKLYIYIYWQKKRAIG